MGPEVLAVLAGMLGVTLIAGSRLRARRRAPAAPTLAAAAPTGRWGESRLPAADFDEWHEEETAPRPAAVAAPVAAAPALEDLGEAELDDVFAGREPAPREPDGRFAKPAAPPAFAPEAHGVSEAPPAPRGGAAGFRSAPRRRGLGGLLANPAVRAAAYAAAGIALVALIVNLALGGGSEPAAERVTTPAAPTAQAPAPEPAGPTPAEIAARREAAAAAFTDATAAAAIAERRARAAERRAIRRRRAAAARRRRAAAGARRQAPRQPSPAPPAPSVPAAPSAPPSGGGGGGGNPQCELGCIG